MTRPHVFPDANVLISFLLVRSRPDRTFTRLMSFGIDGGFSLVVSDEVFAKVRRSTRRPHLAAKMPPQEVEGFLTALAELADHVSSSADPLPRICRDSRDDYLIAQAISSGATHLLTGDRDLLALRDAGLPFEVGTPAERSELLGIPGD